MCNEFLAPGFKMIKVSQQEREQERRGSGDLFRVYNGAEGSKGQGGGNCGPVAHTPHWHNFLFFRRDIKAACDMFF